MKISDIVHSEYDDFYIKEIINEQEFDSLGLIKYNSGSSICTFVEKFDYIDKLEHNVSMVITTSDVAKRICSKDYGVIISDFPRITYFKLHNQLSKTNEYKRKPEKIFLGENVKIGEMASISKNNVYIGNNVIIEDFVSIYENTYIGDNSIIRSGSRIGGCGFEFKKSGSADERFFVEHVGGVVIGNNVEIQYNTCVDKAVYPWDDTIIDDYTKIDNLVYIAHGTKLGKLSQIAAGATIGGRCIIEENVWVGLGAVIRNGINIGANSRVNMGAVVTKNVMDGEAVTGNFAINHKQFIKNLKNK